MIRAATETRKWWALGGITLAVLAVTLDATILSVALPTLAGVFHASETDLQWFSSAYLLVLAAAMLPAGLLGDRYGRKKVLLASLVLFGAGSAVCAYAPSTGAFIAARVVLGAAGAGIVVMALSAITVLFTEEERPRAVGVWGAANFVAFPIGPILGGWLLTNYWWGWVFLINVPVALVGLVAALALVPESRALQRPALDPVGTAASVAGLVGVTYGLIEAGQHGWTDSGALGSMLAGLAILVGFFLWEHRLGRQPGGQPLVDLGLFQSRSFTWGVILTATAIMAMIGVLFTLPQYSQAVLGVDAMGSGLRLVPLVGGLLAGMLPAALLVRFVGAKLMAACGFAVMGAGLLLGATTAVTSGQGFALEWTAVVGVGLGLTFATTASAAIAKLPQERSGVGAAVFQALQKVGGPFGAAVLGSVLASAYQAELHLVGLPPAVAKAVEDSVFGGLAVAGQLRSAALAESVRAAFVHGMDVALLVSAGITMVGIVLALAFLPGRSAAIAAGPAPEKKGGPRAVAG
jgi:MFS transporter, DHA2 family, multidrug resistance protein